jgi:hypothetical protein
LSGAGQAGQLNGPGGHINLDVILGKNKHSNGVNNRVNNSGRKESALGGLFRDSFLRKNKP